jgi:hypothetical protein
MSGDLDLLISKKEEALQSLCIPMEELRLQFIRDTTNFASKWYEETAKEYVVKNPEISLRMSRETIASMKAKVINLAKNAGKVVNAALSSKSTWWHMEPSLYGSAQYEQTGNSRVGHKFPEKVDKPVRRALGELGTVLEQYGFNVATNPAMKTGYPEFWFTASEGKGGEAQPYYPHVLIWSQEMQNTLQKYNDLFLQAIALFNEIQKLKDERTKLQTTQLWDST